LLIAAYTPPSIRKGEVDGSSLFAASKLEVRDYKNSRKKLVQ
jgi:hypothetical protein